MDTIFWDYIFMFHFELFSITTYVIVANMGRRQFILSNTPNFFFFFFINFLNKK